MLIVHEFLIPYLSHLCEKPLHNGVYHNGVYQKLYQSRVSGRTDLLKYGLKVWAKSRD